ncbi:hypothetical protein OAX78_02715 [Planctomycetota bacterium]|nr:hypothetical protein [Planctomycetota bacterium]
MSAPQHPAPPHESATVSGWINYEVVNASPEVAAAIREQSDAHACTLAVYDAVAFLRQTYTISIAALAAALEDAPSGRDPASTFASVEAMLTLATKQIASVKHAFAVEDESA